MTLDISQYIRLKLYVTFCSRNNFFKSLIAGEHVVRERAAETEEGEQDDVGAEEQAGRRGRRRLRRRRQGQGRRQAR